MGTARYRRHCREAVAEGRRELFARWLDALPDRGWEGTAADFLDELTLLAGPRDWVPSQAACVLDDAARLLDERGWEVWTRRTARARLITFRRREQV
jgi:hypothetical protein